MALAANTLPSIVPELALPRDSAMEFTSAETITATGYLGSSKQLDLGNGAATGYGPGRIVGWWAIDISAWDLTTTDETYALYLLGSNDVAWGNGNVELLAMHDFGLAAHRVINTILGTTPTIPPTNRAGTLIGIPWTNLMQGIVYRYVRNYIVIAGTTPTITLSTWLSPLGEVD